MKQFYKALVPLVNNEYSRDALVKYADHRIETLRTYLEVQKDHTKILELQGAIAELKRLQTLKDEVTENLKNV